MPKNVLEGLRPIHRKWLGSTLLAAIVFLGLSPRIASADPSPTPATRKPVTRVDLPTLTAQNPTASVTVDTPYGPATLTATLSESTVVKGGGASAQAVYSRTCSASYTNGIVSHFGIQNTFQYDYSSVTWMGGVSYSEWYVPPTHVDDEQVWTTWWPGIQYAYADGRASSVTGYGPFAVIFGWFHVWIQEDAWGNCTPHATFTWT